MSKPPMFEEKHKYLSRKPQQIPNGINSKRSETLYTQTTERQRQGMNSESKHREATVTHKRLSMCFTKTLEARRL